MRYCLWVPDQIYKRNEWVTRAHGGVTIVPAQACLINTSSIYKRINAIRRQSSRARLHPCHCVWWPGRAIGTAIRSSVHDSVTSGLAPRISVSINVSLTDFYYEQLLLVRISLASDLRIPQYWCAGEIGRKSRAMRYWLQTMSATWKTRSSSTK